MLLSLGKLLLKRLNVLDLVVIRKQAIKLVKEGDWGTLDGEISGSQVHLSITECTT